MPGFTFHSIRHFRTLISALARSLTGISLLPLLALLAWSPDPGGSEWHRDTGWIGGKYKHFPSSPPISTRAGFLLQGGKSFESQAANQETLVLLPDLRTKLPSGLYIQTLENGDRLLRLANTIWNAGEGPLELEGFINAKSQKTLVKQHIYTADGGVLEHLVGEFVWHPTHNHWHFDDFTIYELWALDENGEMDRVVASSDKLSYCIIDTQIVDNKNPFYVPRRSYLDCGQRLQGLSAGWGDRYKASLDGQSLELNGLADGIYALVSTANPTGILLESDTDNNSATAYIEIHGNQVYRVPAGETRSMRSDG